MLFVDLLVKYWRVDEFFFFSYREFCFSFNGGMFKFSSLVFKIWLEDWLEIIMFSIKL